jgi:hypothetical protein
MPSYDHQNIFIVQATYHKHQTRVEVTNTLAYNGAVAINTVKSIILQNSGANA